MEKDQKFNTYDYIFKVILIGSASVGKTSLLSRFCDDVFTDSYQSTIGIDFRIKTIKIDQMTIKIQIWDTAGQERYQSIATTHYKGADGVFCIFDVTNRESFEKVKDHLKKCLSAVAIPQECVTIIGNKSDLSRREIEIEVGEDLAKELNANYIETSAKTGENVPLMFQNLCNKIIKEKKILNESGFKNDRQNLALEKAGEIIENNSNCSC